MALYAIGDVQGCYRELMQLLKQIKYNTDRDMLWFAGDLVNRGPDSLKTLRFVKNLGDGARVVLGNHDLHLLAMSQGNLKHAEKDHTLREVLKAKDRDDLLEWLRQRPLMHHCSERNYSLIHAGLPPQWDLATALQCAAEVEAVLQGDGLREFCLQMYGNEPGRWSNELQGMERHRFIINCFTRLRFCDSQGNLALKEKRAPGHQPSDFYPWFAVPDRASRDQRILFGHWSTLGYHVSHNSWCLDTGCLWGGKLTALQIRREKPPRPVQVSCGGYKKP
ncbi:symmetrical bis(5'-nucleosyl)-tetraphosphatase [Sedimenticola selenatireducens]|uniref:Bis(5'-nucleosyl)-tetraphosphatase, symmetrical n=1 Tax=Sedimenticola selenatireducens TaxID=191960 RepID=A0A2N6CTL2_9GAMM|nr:symmetrical bis(5'-nucleosyl)-tetraphosphatase [Sedimenticola selenatireducens]PLX60503.1 MAG: diadenosine tetraphosphatase [Sedimenticola selenatireducens]